MGGVILDDQHRAGISGNWRRARSNRVVSL
jgi:hypothetical protein